jgi:hypothetical protein
MRSFVFQIGLAKVRGAVVARFETDPVIARIGIEMLSITAENLQRDPVRERRAPSTPSRYLEVPAIGAHRDPDRHGSGPFSVR